MNAGYAGAGFHAYSYMNAGETTVKIYRTILVENPSEYAGFFASGIWSSSSIDFCQGYQFPWDS